MPDIRIAVVGGGTMGNGIAHTAARAGFAVQLCEINDQRLEQALATIAANLERERKKGKLSPEQVAAALDSIEGTTQLERLSKAALVIEAIPERPQLKQELFQKLDRLLQPSAILASNTSAISITSLAAATERPDRFIGMHFMNPAPVMPLVELVCGIATSDDTRARVKELTLALGKTPVEVQDYPGFVSNRVLMPMLNEAMYCVFEGVGTAEAVDQVMKLGMNHPMGPLTLADFIGLDVCLDILQVLYDGFQDNKYRPCPLLKRMVAAGWLGRKSGRGFFNYR